MLLPKLFTTALLATVVLSLLGADEIKGRGAVFPAPLYQTWAADYFETTPQPINYIPTDSEEAIKSVTKGLIDFAGSDKPLSPKILEKKKLYLFPTVVGAVVLTYNIDGVKDGALKLSRAAIKGIFNGSITFWDDQEIVRYNADLKLPHQPIRVVVQGDNKSATTWHFTHFLHQLDRTINVSKKPTWRAKRVIVGASNAEVSAKILQLKNTIGYLDYAFKKKLGLSAAQIENREGKFINPTLPSFQDAVKSATWSAKRGFYALIDDPKGETSYPIVAASYMVLPAQHLKHNKKVTAFIQWAYKQGDASAMALGYVPLPQETKDAVKKYWKRQGIE